MNQPKPLVFHPLLFACFPTLALLANNIQEVALAVAGRPLLYSFVGAAVLFLLVLLFVRNLHKAGIITSFTLLLFFSYGHIYHALKDIGTVGQIIGRHRFLVVVYLALAVIGTWWIGRKVKNERGITPFLNLVSVVLLIYPFYQIIRQQRIVSDAQGIASILISQEESLDASSLSELPDIYYIILDTYTRADSMQSFFGFDNTAFLDSLRQMGFVVADCSRCNHCYTQGSLASSLNMNYLPYLEGALRDKGVEPDTVPLIKYSLIRGHLEALGYQTVAFETSFFWTTITDAEIYLGLKRPSIFDQLITPFESMLIQNSAGLVLSDFQHRIETNRREAFSRSLIEYPFSEYISRELFILDNLPKVASIPGPTWMFAHISIPHPPRVFKPDGEIVDDPGYYSGNRGGPINGEYEQKGYINEVQFINHRMIDILEIILSNSSSPPIIVLQGDTGGPGPTKYNILNAYYFMGETNPDLYAHITPVNTFRLIFDSYFGANYGLLPDVTYRDDLSVVPEDHPACIR